jgi:hypothetical protein
MAAYGLRGTPSTLIIDREGYLVRHSFGAEDDLALGMLLGSMLLGSMLLPHRTGIRSDSTTMRG